MSMRSFLYQRRSYLCAIWLLTYGVCEWLGLRHVGPYLLSFGLIFLSWLGNKQPDLDDKVLGANQKGMAIVGAVVAILGGLFMLGNQFIGDPAYFAPKTVSFLVLLLSIWGGCCMVIFAMHESEGRPNKDR